MVRSLRVTRYAKGWYRSLMARGDVGGRGTGWSGATLWCTSRRCLQGWLSGGTGIRRRGGCNTHLAAGSSPPMKSAATSTAFAKPCARCATPSIGRWPPEVCPRPIGTTSRPPADQICHRHCSPLTETRKTRWALTLGGASTKSTTHSGAPTVPSLNVCMGDAAGTAESFADLVADRIRVLGPDHPDTVTSQRELAYWQDQAGTEGTSVQE